jgi:hypothetical protein
MSKTHNQTKNGKLKHITVSVYNYDEIRKYGEFGDSFDDVITKILHSIEPQHSRKISSQQTEGGI